MAASKYLTNNYCAKCTQWKPLADFKLDTNFRKRCTTCGKPLRVRPHNPGRKGKPPIPIIIDPMPPQSKKSLDLLAIDLFRELYMHDKPRSKIPAQISLNYDL